MKTQLLLFVLLFALMATLLGSVTFSGTVLNSAGNPVPDFEIYFMDEEGDAMFTTSTGSDGSYRLISDWDGYYLVGTEIWDPSMIDPVDYELETTDGETYSDLNFTVLTGTDFAFIEGTVYHWIGEPISGRCITATGPDVYREWSDHSGEYSIRCLPGTYHVMLDVETEPYSYDFTLAAGETRSGVDFNMLEIPDDSWVNVQVIDAASSTISGIDVHLVSDFVDETETTDDTGYANFEVWGRHNYTLTCDAGEMTCEPASYAFLLPEGETVEYTFTLIDSAATEYQIFVNAMLDGAPIAGITFELSMIGTSSWISEVTSDAGCAMFTVTATGDFLIRPSDSPTYNIFPELDTITVTESGTLDTLRFTVYPEDIKEAPMPENLGLTAYPNPFNGAVSLQIPQHTASIEIYDIKGNMLQMANSFDSNTYIWQPTRDIESGIYTVRAISENSNASYCRIIYIK